MSSAPLETAASLIPPEASLERLQQLAAHCQACPLWRKGTQTVFGEGPSRAKILLVGEQPGDQEDLAGRPFVGPAGKLLNKALEEAGIVREEVYVTNVVKHFKWEARGPRRLHKKPNEKEIAACRPWLEAELKAVRPKVLVCLGATAAQALLGADFRLTRQRGQWVPAEQWAPRVMATLHPSAILRMPKAEFREEAYAGLVADLRQACAG